MTLSPPVVRMALAAAMLVLAWRVIHVNAVLYDDDGRPRLALAQPGGVPKPEALAAVLEANPAEVAALLGLAVEYERAGDEARAAGAHAAALRIAPIDRGALQAAAAYDLRHGRVREALLHLDRLAEHYGDTRERIFPLLAQIISTPAHGAALESLAARDATWLGAFIEFACGRDLQPKLLVPLLMRRVGAGKAKPREVACVTDRLREAGLWEDAYQAWLNTLPRERLADVGFIFNGSFEHAPSGIGFDWRPATGSDRNTGHAVEFPAASGVAGKRALRVTYNGKRQAGAAISQYLALEPGRYQVAGRARIESLQSVRGVQWGIKCIEGGQREVSLAASSRFLGSSDWEPFSFAVSIPSTCRGQVLRLEPVGMNEGTTFLSGSAWFDDLRLTRAR